jgi:glycosyltransferase involved in cell wall biosynthesis
MCHNIAVIILVKNEIIHIERSINSALKLTNKVYVVDSNSQDGTFQKAEELGAIVHNCDASVASNFSDKFNWALDNLNINENWLVRLDADEFFLPKTIQALPQFLSSVDESVCGISMNRRIHFKGRWIKNGGQYPRSMIRITRNGCARYEHRLLDEQVVLKKSKSIDSNLDFVDDNLNSISSWVYKHDAYSNMEAIEILHLQIGLFNERSVDDEVKSDSIIKSKRKKSAYLFWPPYLRPFIYFFYRFILQFGFLDGVPGFLWHFLQGWWYRVLVEIKLQEIIKECGSDRDRIVAFIKKNYSIDIN